MKHEQLAKAYKAFFFESDEGQYFVSMLEQFISTDHEKAEDAPESSRDYSQRAKGTREVLSHIRSVTTAAKKGTKGQ